MVGKCPFPQNHSNKSHIPQKAYCNTNNQPWTTFDPLPLELGYKKFDTLVESFEYKKVYIIIGGTTPGDAILNLSRTGHQLRDENQEWFKAKTHLLHHPKYGVFNTALSTVYVDLCYQCEDSDWIEMDSIQGRAFLKRDREISSE